MVEIQLIPKRRTGWCVAHAMMVGRDISATIIGRKFNSSIGYLVHALNLVCFVLIVF